MGTCREQRVMHSLRWPRHGTCRLMAALLPFSLLTNWRRQSREFLPRTCFDRQQSCYRAWAPRFARPPEQFEKTYDGEIEEFARSNPVIRLFTPSLPRFRWAEAYNQTRRTLLQTAIAVRLDGPRALNQHLDPYDKKPFSYIPIDGGFRLESRLSEGAIPMSLSIVANFEARTSTPK